MLESSLVNASKDCVHLRVKAGETARLVQLTGEILYSQRAQNVYYPCEIRPRVSCLTSFSNLHL